MNEIIFNKTNNFLLDSGIISLEYYLNKCKINNDLGYNDFEFYLTENTLKIKCDSQDKLFKLLEEVYYYMGNEIYNTSGKKAQERIDKYYFTKNPFHGEPFYKMKTYGLAELITNDPTPKAKIKENKIKYRELIKKDSDFAEKIAKFYFEKNKRLKGYNISKDGILTENIEQKQGDSEIFLNEPYTKAPIFFIDEEFFTLGNNSCSLTNEKYFKLVKFQNTSPFISGLENFNSFSHSDKNNDGISWKAMYLSWFSPKLSLYKYQNGLDRLLVYYFESDNLLSIKNLYKINNTFYKDEQKLINDNYLSNFELYGFNKEKKEIYFYNEEIAFMLIYSFYKQFLESNNIKIEEKELTWDPFEEMGYKNIPVSLTYFRADKFSGTLRPNSFEKVNNFKFIVRLIYYFEKNEITFKNILQSIKLARPNDKDKFQHERLFRNKILSKILKTKSVINEIEKIFYDSYKYLCSNDGKVRSIGFKDFKQIINFLTLYEPIIKYGGNKNMDKELQQKAINLGKSIGQAIIHHGDETPQINVKNGRTYIIALKKSRTLQQFLDEIIRLQSKYSFGVSNDLMENISEKNFVYIKQFALISALNQLNSVLTFKKSDKDEKE